MIIAFEGIENEKVKRSFTEALSRFPALHDDPVLLERKELKGSTMQAQPILSLANLFSKHRAYRVRISEFVRSSDILVDGLPENVLRGWFAHEFGHLSDFEGYTNFQMIGYGAKYLLSGKERRNAEFRADELALRAGFKEDLLAALRWVLDNDQIDQAYKDKMGEYYMGIDDIELWCHTDQKAHIRGVIDVKGTARKMQLKKSEKVPVETEGQ